MQEVAATALYRSFFETGKSLNTPASQLGPVALKHSLFPPAI
jgi:hypothetical protein